jgi:DNA-binding SARP family transcriptional activator
MGTRRPTTPAKITRPDPAASYPRARLFKWLDRAQSRRCVWIMGPPGSGKTTLVADYLARRRLLTVWVEADRGDSDLATFFHFLTLAAHKALPHRRRPLLACTAERLQDPESFARDYFRDLYASFGKPFVLVLDNVQDLATDSATLEVLRLAIECLPENGQLIALSRTEPPAPLARMRLNGNLALLEDDALRLTLDETLGIAAQRLGKRPPRARIAALHELTHGWTAGLVLLLEQTDLKLPDTPASFKTPGVLFDYFASEVFNKADADTRNVLLKSVFLPTMTARQAVALSGERRAGRILTQLSRHHFFTIRYDLTEPVFQYHPLFREFLRSRATRLLDAESLHALRRQAARLLEEAGNAEAALALYEEATDWEGYGHCLSAQASQLLEEGRHEALEQWLSRLPPEAMEHSPWLLYWDASARLTRRPVEGRARFEQAMDAFAAAGNAHGARLAWCNIVSSIVHEGARFDTLNSWIERFAALPVPPTGPAGTDAPVTASMLAALALTRPQQPDTRMWAEHALNLLLSRTDINKRLGAGIHLLYYHLYRGEMVRAASVASRLNEGRRAHPVSPLMQLLTHISTAFHDWLAGQSASALAAAQSALALGESSGIRLWDNYILGHAVAAELSRDNIEAAQLWLDRMTLQLGNARPLDAGFYHTLLLWRALLTGDLPVAREQLSVLRQYERAVQLWFGELGILQAEAQTELAAGNPEAASEPIRRLLAGAEQHGSKRYVFIGNLLAAQQAFDLHRDDEGLTRLGQALAIGREHRLVNFHGFLPRVMARLCARALEANIETGHVRAWIALRALPVTDEARDLETWPWPIRLYTFGRLSIVSHDKPLKFSGRAQSRPLELLAALIAHGGRGVAEETLSEELWPDSEGDAAHRAFEITLHRLRKLLGNDEALVLSDSKLSLNPSVCWVDVWTLERQLGRADALLRETVNAVQTAELQRLGNRLLALYRGPFLGSGEKAAWAVTARERLHSKFLCQLNALAQHWERQARWTEASDLYQKAIDIQGHSEEYYQRLMQAYLKMQRPSEALAVYRRASQTLAASLGRKPSPALETILQKINSALEVQK